jgi:putative ABC transport system permease protein
MLKLKTSLLIENIRIALNAIRASKLRTVLTIFIIAIGIMALVGILTAIESIKKSITDQFTLMGANTFTIESRSMNIQMGDKHYRKKNHSRITYQQAVKFKEMIDIPVITSISTHATGIATLKYKSKKSNPNIPVIGSDENYLQTSGNEIEKGRNFSQSDIKDYRNVAILGSELADVLFGKYEDPIGEIILTGGGKYLVIGILKSKGASITGLDKICILPITTVRHHFSRPNMRFSINVMPLDQNMLEMAKSEAEGVFRIVRGLTAKDESDFNITSSDNLVEILLENIKFVTIAATLIGLITLFGAVVGLMNIMLVSVKERTKEIGIRKAIGAKALTIKRQFLYEAILIGQIGGLVGIILGILAGNMISLLTKTSFIVPWDWIIAGVLACLAVGLISGYVPAVKASKLDPIIALHYE